MPTALALRCLQIRFSTYGSHVGQLAVDSDASTWLCDGEMEYQGGDNAPALALLAEDPQTLRAQAIQNRERISSVEDHYRNLLALYEELLTNKRSERR